MEKFNTFIFTFLIVTFSTSLFAQVVAPLEDGGYVIQFVESAGFIDNSGYPGPGGENPNIGVFWPQGSPFQRFNITQVADGYYRINSILSEESNITIEGSSKDDMGNIIQANWVDNDYQKWQILELQGGNYKIISKANGKAWHAHQFDANEFNLRNIVQMTAHDTDLQKFKFIATADSVPSGPYETGKTYAIASEMSSMVMSEEEVGVDRGNLVQHIYRGKKSQQWELNLVESDPIKYFTITNKESGLSLTLEEITRRDGVNVITAPLSENEEMRDYQLWGIEPVIGVADQNHVNVFSKMNDGRAIEIAGGPQPFEGQNLATWWRFENTEPWHRWQRWRFVMLDQGSVSVQSIEKNTSLLRVYPNPANDYIIVSVEANFGEGSVSLTDISGKVINHMPYSFTEGQNEVSFRLNGIASGIYFVNVKVPNGSILVKKVLIKE